MPNNPTGTLDYSDLTKLGIESNTQGSEAPNQVSAPVMPSTNPTGTLDYSSLSQVDDDAPDPYKSLYGMESNPDNPEGAELRGFVKNIQDSTILGVGSIYQGSIGMEMAFNPKMTIDDAKKKYETQQMIEAAMGVENYAKKYGDFHAATMLGKSAEMGPYMGLAVTGSAIGAGLGGIAGVGLTAATGGLAAPAIPALVTLGAGLGAFVPSASVAFGNMNYELQVNQKMSRDSALVGSVTSGLITGSLDVAGLGFFSKSVKVAAMAALKTPMGKELLKKQIRNYFKTLGIETSIEVIQQMSDSSIKFLTALSNGSDVYPLEKMWEEILQTIKGAAQGFPGIILGGHIASHHAGSLGKHMQTILDAETKKIIDRIALREQEKLLAIEKEKQKLIHAELTVTKSEQKLANAKTKVREIRNVRGAVRVEEGTEIPTELDLETAKAEVESAQKDLEVAKIELKAIQMTQGLQLEGGVQAFQESSDSGTKEPYFGKSNAELISDFKEATKNVNEEIDYLEDSIAEEEANGNDPAELREQLKLAKGEKRRLKELRNKVELSKAKDELESLSKDKSVVEKVKEKVKTTYDKLKQRYLDIKRKNVQQAIDDDLAATEKQLAKVSMKAHEMEEESKNDPLYEFEFYHKRWKLQDLRNKREELRNRVEHLKKLNELIRNDRLRLEDLESIDQDLPSGKIDVVVDKASKLALRASLDAIKITNKSVNEIQAAIRKLINLSGLELEDQARIADLKAASTPEKLAEYIDYLQKRIDSLVEAASLRKAKAEVEEQLKGIDPKKRGKIKYSKFPGVQETLEAISTFWHDKEAAPEAIAKALKNDSEGNHNAMEELEGYIANVLFSKPVAEMTSKEVEHIASELERLKRDGHSSKLAHILNANRRREDIAQKLLGRMALPDPGKSTDKPTKKTFKQQLKLFGETFGTNWFSWEGIQTIITQHGGMSENFDLFDPFKLFSEERKNAQEWRDKFNEILLESIPGYKAGIITQEQVRQHILGGDEEVYIGSYIRKHEDGTISFEELHLSRNQAIQLYAFMQDKELRFRLTNEKGNGFTLKEDTPFGASSTEQLIEDSLKNDNISLHLVDGIQKFYQEYFARTDAYAFKRTGRHLDKNPGYGGTADTEVDRKGFFEGLFRRSTASPTAMKERVPTSSPLQIRSFAEKIGEHIDQTEHALSFAEFESDAPAVFSDPRVKERIKNSFGKDIFDVIMLHINDLIKGRYQMYDAQSKVFGYFRHNAFTFYLSFRPDQYLKQITGFFMFRMFVDHEAYMSGLSDFILHPKEAIAVMNKSALLKERASLMDRDWHPSNAVLKEASVLKKDPTMKEVLSVLVQLGDVHATYAGGWAVYRDTLMKTGDKEAAMLAFERAFNTTQSSGTIDQLPGFFRGNEINKMLTIFTQQPTRATEFALTALRKYANSKTEAERKANKKAAVKAILVLWAAEALYVSIIPVISMPFMSDSDRDEKIKQLALKGLLGPVGGAAFAGPVVTAGAAIGASALGVGTSGYPPGFLITDLAKEVMSVSNRVKSIQKKGLTANDTIKLLRSMAKIYGTSAPPQYGGGLPLETPLKWVDELIPNE